MQNGMKLLDARHLYLLKNFIHQFVRKKTDLKLQFLKAQPTNASSATKWESMHTLWHICKPTRRPLLSMEGIKCTDATVFVSKAIITTAAIVGGLKHGQMYF